MKMSHVGVFVALIAAGLCDAAEQAPPVVPAELKPPAGEELLIHALASGDQIYTCDGSKWVLSGPDAMLSDEAGRRVTGRAVANATPDSESIPWLLLAAASHESEGVMKNVFSIQRLHTKGGRAPASGCTASRKDEKMRVHYTAEYYFYGTRR